MSSRRFGSRSAVSVAVTRSSASAESLAPPGPATVRWIARPSPVHTHVAAALAISPAVSAESSKSRSETARPKVRTVPGAASRAWSSALAVDAAVGR